MKVVIAPDSFKESLPALEVARALAEGVRAACPSAEVDLCPMADGGGGTVAAMVAATGGRILSAEVAGPFGEPVRAEFGLLGQGVSAERSRAASGERSRAVIEMAAASGLHLVPPGRRNPMLTTTYGTGQLILAALDAGAGEIILGIGGSATTDGGAGCAQAVGVGFADASGRPCTRGLAGGDLKGIARIDLAGRDPRIAAVRTRVACDVTNPLTGPNGAAAVYGPQKGATPEMVRRLDEGLHHLAGLIRRQLGVDVESLPGAGAAGGLGAGLVAFLGARLERGAAIVAEAVGLLERLRGADLCLTGEGRFDSQSLSGKTAVGVAGVARQVGVPVLCLPGQAEAGLADRPQVRAMFAAVNPLAAGDVTVADAMARTRELLRLRAQEAVGRFAGRV